ncbi:hypothetical protein SUGI_0711330 [Cryptomeria japonica]|nr:hypothetical protein SUGI_0711330 [Cryptomeria japonica]
MIRRWIEMQREKEDWNVVVLTGSSWEETEEGRKALMLKAAATKIFDEEGLLTDIHGRPFYSSSLPPASCLIFIIEDYGHFSAFPSEVTKMIVAYTPSSKKTSLFFGKVSATLPQIHGRYTSVFRSRFGSEVKAIKCPSVWEDVSYILNEPAFLLRGLSESNVEILRAMLQTDFLLKNCLQVKLMDLQGKVILLLQQSLLISKMRYSTFNDKYMKMQHSHHNLVEVVWVPDCDETEEDEFKRVAAKVPWPVVPNPWLIQRSLRHLFSLIEVPDNLSSWSPAIVVVLDGKGRISNKNAWEMIERWGEEAFP